MNAVMNEAKLILTNPDFVCPVPEGYSRYISNRQRYCLWVNQEKDAIIDKPSYLWREKYLKH